MKMGIAGSLEMVVPIYLTAQRYIPENCHNHKKQHCESQKALNDLVTAAATNIYSVLTYKSTTEP